MEKMVLLNGGQRARDAIVAYLDKYGMRCAGEIDITRARWNESQHWYRESAILKPRTWCPIAEI